jgi:signal transduction histidine kinase/predicted negative regulator of RcsB-dependent stress response
MRRILVVLLSVFFININLAQDYTSKAYLEDSLPAYETCIKIVETAKLRKDHLLLAYGYHYLGRYYSKSNQRTKTLSYYFKALKIAERLGHSPELRTMIKFRIATTYIQEPTLTKDAQAILNETIQYYRKTNNHRLVVLHLINLSRFAFDAKNYDEALELLDEAFIFNQSAKHPLATILYYNQRGRVHLELRNINQARENLAKSLAASNQANNQRMACLNLYFLAYCDELEKKWDKAIHGFESTIKLANQSYSTFVKRDCYERLAICFEAKNVPNVALKYINQYMSIADSLRLLNNVESMNFIKVVHEKEQVLNAFKQIETEKRLVEIESLANRQRWYITLAICGLILLTGVFGIIFYRQKLISKRHEIESNELKIKEMKSDRDLSIMQALLEGQDSERERISQDLHDGLGGMLAQLKFKISSDLKYSPKSIDEVSIRQIYLLIEDACREVRNISNNLQPATLRRFGLIAAIKDYIYKMNSSSKPKITLNVIGDESNIPVDKKLMLFRTIQEALNNVLKHADASEVLVQLHIDKEGIVIEVEDDGIGFDPEQDFDGMGIKNIRMRAKYLDGILHFTSIPQEGTNFLLQVPFNT